MSRSMITIPSFSTWFVNCSMERWTVHPTRMPFVKCSVFTLTPLSRWTRLFTIVSDRYGTRSTNDSILDLPFVQLQAIVTEQSSEAIMRLHARPNGTVGLVEDLYTTAQQNAEAAYQREMEAYADGNRLFRLCSVRHLLPSIRDSSQRMLMFLV